jgi:hypothetical protein
MYPREVVLHSTLLSLAFIWRGAWVFWNGRIVLVRGKSGEGEEQRNYWDGRSEELVITWRTSLENEKLKREYSSIQELS